MSACKLSCVRKQKNQSADLTKVTVCQKVAEGGQSQIPVSSQQIPITSSGQPATSSSSPRVKGFCEAHSCPHNCPKVPNTMTERAMNLGRTAKDLWKKTNDPFHWQLLKSITMFTLGLKLFNDLYRHMAKSSCK